MRALQLTAPETFHWIDLPEPSSMGPNEVLVAVRAVGVCGTDLSGYMGKMPFIRYPRILGHELGVEVLAVGSDVTHLSIGDHCAVEPYLNCGSCHACKQGKMNCCETLEVLGVHRDGGLKQRLLLPAHKLHRHNELTFEELALVETLAIGCHAVHRANLSPDDTVLILGAGPIGLTVLEFARLAVSPSQITVLELKESRRAFVRKHYPGIKVTDALTSSPVAQVVFDATGNADSMSQALSWAQFTGRVIYVGITPLPIPLDDALLHRRELTLLASRNALSSDFPRILSLIRAGKIQTTPWISHRESWLDLPDLMKQLTAPICESVKAIVILPKD